MSEENEAPAAPKVHKAFATTRQFPIQLAEDQEPVNFVVRTMRNKDKTDYLNLMQERAKFNAAGRQTGISKFDGIEAKLILKCVFHPDGTPLTADVVDEWPAPLVTALFRECMDVNGMTPDAEKDAKK